MGATAYRACADCFNQLTLVTVCKITSEPEITLSTDAVGYTKHGIGVRYQLDQSWSNTDTTTVFIQQHKYYFTWRLTPEERLVGSSPSFAVL